MTARKKLTHLDRKGAARMVDVGAKAVTERRAVARGLLRVSASTIALVRDGATPKGDVLAAARLAGIMAAKRTSDLIPLTHPLPLTHASVELVLGKEAIEIEATVATSARTGVEMEALTAVMAACLTIYDFAKRNDRSMEITSVRLIHKSGGRTGDWNREGEGTPPRAAEPLVTPARGTKKLPRQ